MGKTHIVMLYLEDLTKLKCQNPECDHTGHDKALILNQACHPEAGQKVTANAMEGVLTIQCNECGGIVCEIAIASNSTHDDLLLAEEASRQLYGSLCNTLAHFFHKVPDKKREAEVLKTTMDTIDRYRNHYQIDVKPRKSS